MGFINSKDQGGLTVVENIFRVNIEFQVRSNYQECPRPMLRAIFGVFMEFQVRSNEWEYLRLLRKWDERFVNDGGTTCEWIAVRRWSDRLWETSEQHQYNHHH